MKPDLCHDAGQPICQLLAGEFKAAVYWSEVPAELVALDIVGKSLEFCHSILEPVHLVDCPSVCVLVAQIPAKNRGRCGSDPGRHCLDA